MTAVKDITEEEEPATSERSSLSPALWMEDWMILHIDYHSYYEEG